MYNFIAHINQEVDHVSKQKKKNRNKTLKSVIKNWTIKYNPVSKTRRMATKNLWSGLEIKVIDRYKKSQAS